MKEIGQGMAALGLMICSVLLAYQMGYRTGVEKGVEEGNDVAAYWKDSYKRLERRTKAEPLD